MSARPDASEEDLVRVARSELDVLGLGGEPTLVRVRRRPRALPVYGVGHGPRVAHALARAASHGRVALAGNYLHGVGVPDAIASGLRASDALFRVEVP